MNAAYRADYQEYRKEYDGVFDAAHRTEPLSGAQWKQLNPRYWVRTRHYEGKVGEYAVSCSEHELFGTEEGGFWGPEQNFDRPEHGEPEPVFSWRNINDDGEFVSLIQHQNGKEYLIYRQDLYGYSVCDLKSLEAFQYLPSESFPGNGEAFQETFIWTEVNYSRESNMLAVSGCYWACPYSVVVLDFTEPLKEQKWINICELFNEFFENYDEAEFVEWAPDGGMAVKLIRCDGGVAECIKLDKNLIKK